MSPESIAFRLCGGLKIALASKLTTLITPSKSRVIEPTKTLVIKPLAIQSLSITDIVKAVRHHLSGDWGDISEIDRDRNENAVRERKTILSVYRSAKGIKFWVLTDPVISTTTILLPRQR